MIHKHNAIIATHPNVVNITGDNAFDINGAPVIYNEAVVQAYIEANQYKQQRVAEYPSIGDQLDDLFRQGAFSPEMAATLQAVKTAHPKGTS